MLECLFFYSMAALVIITALLVIFTRHPVYSVLYLVLTMFALAAIYVLLGAYFVAAIQLIVYAGAILVLFLFVVMLLNLDQEGDESFRAGPSRWLAVPFTFAFICEFYTILEQFFSSRSEVKSLIPGTIQAIGNVLFTRHLVAFEVVSFVLLAAILGATVLSKRNWK
jgi:NADH-quinone oxidoreductase subunit J